MGKREQEMENQELKKKSMKIAVLNRFIRVGFINMVKYYHYG